MLVYEHEDISVVLNPKKPCTRTWEGPRSLQPAAREPAASSCCRPASCWPADHSMMAGAKMSPLCSAPTVQPHITSTAFAGLRTSHSAHYDDCDSGAFCARAIFACRACPLAACWSRHPALSIADTTMWPPEAVAIASSSRANGIGGQVRRRQGGLSVGMALCGYRIQSNSCHKAADDALRARF